MSDDGGDYEKLSRAFLVMTRVGRHGEWVPVAGFGRPEAAGACIEEYLSKAAATPCAVIGPDKRVSFVGASRVERVGKDPKTGLSVYRVLGGGPDGLDRYYTTRIVERRWIC